MSYGGCSHIPGKESFIDDLRLLFEHFLLIITSEMSTTIRYRLNAIINITCGPRHLEEPRAYIIYRSNTDSTYTYLSILEGHYITFVGNKVHLWKVRESGISTLNYLHRFIGSHSRPSDFKIITIHSKHYIHLLHLFYL